MLGLLLSTAGAANAAMLGVCTEGGPDIFNSALSNSATTGFVNAQIYDSLISVKKGTSELEGSLAESWTASEDGKTYTFKLRHGVAWQSNKLFKPTREFNADDVVFTFERMMNKAHPYNKVSGGNYVTFNTKLADSLAGVRKVDDYTVEFTLKAALSPFVGILSHSSFLITSAEYADTLTKAGKPEALDREPIGTGPFLLEAYQTDAMVRLKPFHATWGEKQGIAGRTPMVDAVVMAITTDAAVRLQRALAGECQIAMLPNLADAGTIKSSKNLNLISTPVASSGFITYNFRDKKFQDQRVREALAAAINLPSLVEVVYSGMGAVTGSIIPKVLWGHNDDVKARSYDLEKAKKLMAEAGFPNGFETQLWAIPVTRPYMPNGRRAAEMIQEDWAKIGVKVSIVTYEWAEYITRVRAGEAPLAMWGGIWDFPDPSQLPNNYFTCDAAGKPSPSNIGAWCNPDFNALLKKADATTDQAARSGFFKDAQVIFGKELPAVVLGSADTITAVNKSVSGFVPESFGVSRLSGVSVK
jgi:dipeptide transport system substrate-binding protein